MAQELQYHPCLSTTLTVKNECQKYDNDRQCTLTIPDVIGLPRP